MNNYRRNKLLLTQTHMRRLHAQFLLTTAFTLRLVASIIRLYSANRSIAITVGIVVRLMVAASIIFLSRKCGYPVSLVPFLIGFLLTEVVLWKLKKSSWQFLLTK